MLSKESTSHLPEITQSLLELGVEKSNYYDITRIKLPFDYEKKIPIEDGKYLMSAKDVDTLTDEQKKASFPDLNGYGFYSYETALNEMWRKVVQQHMREAKELSQNPLVDKILSHVEKELENEDHSILFNLGHFNYRDRYQKHKEAIAEIKDVLEKIATFCNAITSIYQDKTISPEKLTALMNKIYQPDTRYTCRNQYAENFTHFTNEIEKINLAPALASITEWKDENLKELANQIQSENANESDTIKELRKIVRPQFTKIDMDDLFYKEGNNIHIVNGLMDLFNNLGVKCSTVPITEFFQAKHITDEATKQQALGYISEHLKQNSSALVEHITDKIVDDIRKTLPQCILENDREAIDHLAQENHQGGQNSTPMLWNTYGATVEQITKNYDIQILRQNIINFDYNQNSYVCLKQEEFSKRIQAYVTKYLNDKQYITGGLIKLNDEIEVAVVNNELYIIYDNQARSLQKYIADYFIYLTGETLEPDLAELLASVYLQRLNIDSTRDFNQDKMQFLSDTPQLQADLGDYLTENSIKIEESKAKEIAQTKAQAQLKAKIIAQLKGEVMAEIMAQAQVQAQAQAKLAKDQKAKKIFKARCLIFFVKYFIWILKLKNYIFLGPTPSFLKNFTKLATPVPGLHTKKLADQRQMDNANQKNFPQLQ